MPERKRFVQGTRGFVVDADDHHVLIDRPQSVRTQKAKLRVENRMIERYGERPIGDGSANREDDREKAGSHDAPKALLWTGVPVPDERLPALRETRKSAAIPAVSSAVRDRVKKTSGYAREAMPSLRSG